MADSRVTAIVCTLDNLEILKRQLPILLGEVGRVIVVDNGSEDGTGAWLWDRSEPRLTVINTVNRGAGPGRNHGLDAWAEAKP